MTLSARILIVVGLLGLLLGTVLVADLVPAWDQARQAQERQRLNKTSAELVTAAGALAAERGLTNGMLAAPASATSALQTEIVNNRTRATDALGKALASMPGGAESALTDALSRLDALRRQAVPNSATPLPSGTWFAGATAAIDAVVAQRRRIDVAAGTESPATRLISLRDRLGEMSEFAGRLRGYVNGLINRGGHATGPESQAIGVLTGRINGAWTSIESRLDAYPDAVRQDVQAAGRTWHDDFGPVAQSVAQAAADGLDWPISRQDWFRRATAGIDLLLATQLRSGIAIDAALEEERSQGDRSVLIASSALVTAIVLVIAAIWFVRNRVVGPLRRVISVINQLAAGDLDVAAPAATSSDEIGQLATATVRFRQTAREAKSLTEKHATLAEQATNLREQAIREIGSMIEEVGEQAIKAVVENTARAVLLSDQVHAASVIIVADVTNALGESGRVSESAQVAADGARELDAAIREISGQMGRAALSTRSAVDQAEAARSTFDALAANVSEIGEVAALISQIARQTNLLALNATIEAARAGEAGKGFAVVAGEVKALALQTAQSSGRISQRIGSIEPATREALVAMDAIRQSVGEISAIATAVAAAVEEQSAGVAGVARGVSIASEAASQVNARLDAVSTETGRCEVAAADMTGVARHIEVSVGGLKGTLIRLMRTRVSQFDRRGDPRRPISLPGRLQVDGVAWSGALMDISMGGLAFRVAEPVSMKMGHAAVLTAPGLPSIKLAVVSQHDDVVHLEMATMTEGERSELATAIEQLAPLQGLAA